MSYPSAPWTLQGSSVQTIQYVDKERVYSLLPSSLKVVSAWPGKTMGGLYLGNYGPGSSLEYNELIVVAALVRRGLRAGTWVSHIYVDNEEALEGGREIWGLPKEMAQFHREPGYITVRQGDRLLCRLRCGSCRNLWPMRFPLPAFSVLHSQLMFFKGSVKSRLGLLQAEWEVPSDSPFAGLGLGRSRLTISQEPFRAIIHAGRIV